MSRWKILFILLLFSSPVLASGTPSKRIGHRMIYDPVGERIILYGGAHYSNGYTFYGELCSYDYLTNTWTMLETSNDPEPRFNSMLAYISGRHQLFLFGGFTANDRIGDTWIYDFETSTWTELHPRDHPSPRSDSSICYDPENDVVVLYSGYLRDDSHPQDTWIYSFEEENWIQMEPTDPPLGQYGHYMVYAEETGQLLMYPGHWNIYTDGVLVNHGFGGNIWEYDVAEDAWIEHSATTTPSGRYWGNVVYDSTENQVILFGGNGAIDYDDTWIYSVDDGTWERADQEINPPKRGCSNMAYDPVNQVVVMFGGMSDTGSSLDDIWVLDVPTLTWSQLGSEPLNNEEPEITEATDSEDMVPGFPVWLVLGSIYVFVIMRRFKSHC